MRCHIHGTTRTYSAYEASETKLGKMILVVYGRDQGDGVRRWFAATSLPFRHRRGPSRHKASARDVDACGGPAKAAVDQTHRLRLG